MESLRQISVQKAVYGSLGTASRTLQTCQKMEKAFRTEY